MIPESVEIVPMRGIGSSGVSERENSGCERKAKSSESEHQNQ